MTADAPDAHLTAPIWNWNVYYQKAIETAMNNSADQFVTAMGGPAYYAGLAEGFVDISPLNGKLSRKAPRPPWDAGA